MAGQKQGEKPEVESSKVVAYVGTANSREITKKDWGTVDSDGAESHETTVWDSSNGFKIPADKFTTKQLEYLDKQDSGFVVKETKD